MLNELLKKAEELRQYAELEGTELGDLCDALIATAYRVECTSNEFSAALDKELTAQLDYFKENATIVEREVQSIHKEIALVWLWRN